MTAAAAASSAPTADATAASCADRAHHLPIHNAPSLHNLLALKRQRRSLDEGLRPEPEQTSEAALSAPAPTSPEEQQASLPRSAAIPTSSGGSALAAGSKALADSGFLTSTTFTAPVLQCIPGEPMSSYFPRLRGALSDGSGSDGPQPEARPVTSLEEDGIYLHKRPIRAPNGSSPLAVCGSVLHHVVVLVKQGTQVYYLDFGPANGADVTANILEEAPAKRVMATSSDEVGTGAADPAAAAAPGAPQEEQLPYLYLGPATCGVDHPLVKQLIEFAESRPYHALRNNCIHFADVLVRVMTAGAVRAAPLLYDLKCGTVPPVDNPMLMMMQLMLRMPWFVVVDGSALTAAFLERLNTCNQQPPPQTLSSEPRVAAADSEDLDNKAVASAAGAVTATSAVEAALTPPPGEATGTSSDARPDAHVALPSGTPGASHDSRQDTPPPSGGASGALDEGCGQERGNDHAECGAEPEPEPEPQPQRAVQA